jgi:hypothetical protein
MTTAPTRPSTGGFRPSSRVERRKAQTRDKLISAANRHRQLLVHFPHFMAPPGSSTRSPRHRSSRRPPVGPCLMAHTGAPFPREFGVRRPPTTPGSATARPDRSVGPCAGRRRSHQGSATDPSLLPSQRRVRRSSRRPVPASPPPVSPGARLAARPDTCCLHPAEGFRDRGPRGRAMLATSSC